MRAVLVWQHSFVPELLQTLLSSMAESNMKLVNYPPTYNVRSANYEPDGVYRCCLAVRDESSPWKLASTGDLYVLRMCDCFSMV